MQQQEHSTTGHNAFSLEVHCASAIDAERKKTEHRLRHMQKMEVVGRFAGGIIHDLNNILTVIVGSSQLLLDHPEIGQSAGHRVKQILDAGFRAANLTSQLLAFSRKEPPRPVPLDLNEVVRESSNMIRFLMGNGIELRTWLAADLSNVSADRAQMEQVLINLCVNARDAMPQGGSLLIESENVNVFDSATGGHHFPMKPGKYVRLSISDTGFGMDEQTLSQIFEPFFTTKEPDKGMGLGLATVQCIVKHAHGYIWADSDPGQGSVLTIYLPALPESAARLQPDYKLPEQLRGTETILLVENRNTLSALLRDILENLGYTVLSAEDAERAMQIVEHQKEIALLLTDISLPGMSGLTLAASLRKLHPELKALQMTAPSSGFVNYGLPEEGSDFVRKPFTAETLARKLRMLLDGEPLEAT